MRGARDLKPWDLSPTQYNCAFCAALNRMGLTHRGIGERMIEHDPDITRLMDRLEKRGLVRRERDGKDRRVVITRISESGLDLLAQLDAPVKEFTLRRLSHVGRERLRMLIDLLELVREGASSFC